MKSFIYATWEIDESDRARHRTDGPTSDGVYWMSERMQQGAADDK